jgi:hypothetical protein
MKKTKRTKLVDAKASAAPVTSQEPGIQQPVVSQEGSPSREAVTALEPAATVPAATDKKEKAPSFTTSVRRIVIRRPAFTSAEISQTLIEEGWDRGEVERRKSTIATLRNDALAVIALVKEAGWTPQEGK